MNNDVFRVLCEKLTFCCCPVTSCFIPGQGDLASFPGSLALVMVSTSGALACDLGRFCGFAV